MRTHYGIGHDAGRWSIVGTEHITLAREFPTAPRKYQHIVGVARRFPAGTTLTEVVDAVIVLAKVDPEEIRPDWYPDCSGPGGSLLELLRAARKDGRFPAILPDIHAFKVGAGSPGADRIDRVPLINRILVDAEDGSLRFDPRVKGLEDVVKSLVAFRPTTERMEVGDYQDADLLTALGFSLLFRKTGGKMRHRLANGELIFHESVSPDQY